MDATPLSNTGLVMMAVLLIAAGLGLAEAYDADPGSTAFCVVWSSWIVICLRLTAMQCRKLSRRLTLFGLSVFFLSLIGPCLRAQFGVEAWTVKNGLPQNEVRGLTQTPDGYLWLATLDGLVRFDGRRFNVFKKTNTPGITSNRFILLHQARGGDLWSAYERGGVVRYKDGRFRSYTSRDGLPGEVVSGVTGDEAGTIWVLAGGHIARFNDALDRFEPVAFLESRRYGALVWEDGGFGAYDDHFVYTFSRGELRTYTLPERIRGRGVDSLALDEKGVLWIETSGGEHIRLALGVQGQVNELPPSELNNANGQQYTIRVGQHLMRSIEFSTSGLKRTISFYHRFVDRQGNLWLGTEGEGLYRLQAQSITVYTVEQGLLDRDVYPVYQDRAGSVWIGTWHKGLSRFVGNRFKNYTIADGLPNPLVTALLEDTQGRLWVATHGGVVTFQHGRFDKKKFSVFQELVQAIYQDHEGALWFGMRSGLLRLKEGAWRSFSLQDGLASSDVHVIAQSASGDLWFGGSAGLTQVHNGAFVRWTEQNGLTSNDVWSLYPDEDGSLWIGTFDGGLMRLKEGHLTRYTTQDGLFNDGVFQILDDRDGNLWITCDMGIYRVSKRELNEFADGKRTNITSFPFGSADGLLDLVCNGGMMPAGTRTRDGRLWFPTQDGVAVIDPKQVKNETGILQVVIESALVDQIPASIQNVLRIPPNKGTVEIHYTAPNFQKPEQTRFRYRLEGLDSRWTNAGLRRTAFFTHLPPGRYAFHVSAANTNGVWGPEAPVLRIVILAPFYETWWFECAVLLAVAFGIAALWRYRSSQLRSRTELRLAFLQQLISSQEGERKRIAGELHDSLGQRLVVINAIAKFSLRSRGEVSRAAETLTAFEEISTEALAAMQETRAISYDLRPIHLDRFGLTKAIEHLVKTVSSASNIPMTAKLDDIDDFLPEEKRINLYRIVQEALSNVVKYATATTVIVQITKSEQKAVLTIQDNGKGFHVTANVNTTGRTGLGLRGMSERATLIGGEFRVKSIINEGTLLTVELPASQKQVAAVSPV